MRELPVRLTGSDAEGSTMKRRVNRLVSYAVHAKDGNIGKVREFYFDDHRWTIRYMVVDTGRWLHGRQVLIPTAALEKPDCKSRMFPVKLTRQQVKDSPDIDTDKPISHQHEAELRDYYESVFYWALGLESYAAPEKPTDPHLRSTRQVTGYHILATDGEIGHVEDFIIEDDTWDIRCIVVNARHWLRGKEMLINPEWIKQVSWEKSTVFVDLSQESVRSSLAIDPSKPAALTFGPSKSYFAKRTFRPRKSTCA
jgi:uncharacterized protein YrrD